MENVLDDKQNILGLLGNMNSISKGLTFLGTPENFIQVGLFKHDKNRIMKPHNHIERAGPSICRTNEVLLIWKGRVRIYIFDEDDNKVEDRVLIDGDFYVYFSGGVGYKVLDDNSIMMEAKSGPFFGDEIDRRLIKAYIDEA